MSILKPRAMVGEAIELDGLRKGDEATFTNAGALRVEAVVRPVVIRRLAPHWARLESAREYFHRRARLLRTLDGHGSQRLFAAFGAANAIEVTVEEWIGEISLRRLIGVLHARGPTPIGLALHVGRSLAALWRRFEDLGSQVLLQLAPDTVVVDYVGRVRAWADLSPRFDEHNHGAAVQLMPPTFELMAPELVLGLPLSMRTPMFTLGLLMRETLSGAPLLHRASPMLMLQHLADARFAPVREVRGDVPASFAALVERCLRREPGERYGSWAELDAAFEAARADVGLYGAPELTATMQELFAPAYVDHQVLIDDLAELDFDRLAATLPKEPLPPALVELLLGAPLDTPPEQPALNLEVVDFGRDGRPMLAASERLVVDLRPVTNAEYARYVIATGAAPLAHWQNTVPPTSIQDEPVTQVGFLEAAAYAQWAGKRIPSVREWEHVVRRLGPEALGVGAVWEWTATAGENGLIVRGGRWRNASHLPGGATHLSWADGPGADVGFRCVGDR